MTGNDRSQDLGAKIWRAVTSELEKDPELKKKMERWGEAVTDLASLIPATDVDIIEDIDSVKIKVDLPGFTKNDIKLKICRNVLEIEARRKRPEEGERRMIGRHDYVKKRVLLPFSLETDTPIASAKHENGVLTVSIKNPKPKKVIPIE
jgi:HSP20 family molecular chaperone IbpA